MKLLIPCKIQISAFLGWFALIPYKIQRQNQGTLLDKGSVLVFQVSLFFCQAKIRISGTISVKDTLSAILLGTHGLFEVTLLKRPLEELTALLSA